MDNFLGNCSNYINPIKKLLRLITSSVVYTSNEQFDANLKEELSKPDIQEFLNDEYFVFCLHQNIIHASTSEKRYLSYVDEFYKMTHQLQIALHSNQKVGDLVTKNKSAIRHLEYYFQVNDADYCYALFGIKYALQYALIIMLILLILYLSSIVYWLYSIPIEAEHISYFSSDTATEPSKFKYPYFEDGFLGM